MEQHERRIKWFLGLSLLIVIIFMSFKPLLAKPPEEAALNVTQQTSLNEVPLAAGWNLVSLPNAPASSDPAAVFAAISSEHSITYGFDGCAAGEQWQVYDPAGLSGTNDLTAVDHTAGFWVETTAATVLPAEGTQPPTSTIELCAGWNLIGFPLAQARPVRSALASIEGKYTQVFGFNAADPLNAWLGYDATAPNWSNTLAEMEPGRGYWVYATEDTTLLMANEGPAPVVEITAPAATNEDLPTVTTFTEVFGVINSNLLESWTLAYRPIEGEAWTTIATGNTPLYDELMGTFDPTLLINGLYELQLTAVDFQGQSSADMEIILVDGEQKIGHFSLSFVDVSVPVLGIPIDIIRTYDSRDKEQGDFGVGWTLSTRQGVRVQENAVLGLNWQVVQQGSFVHCLKAVGPHIVAVIIDDTVYRFRATIENECRAFTDPFGLEFITFEALPGTNASLESVTSNLALFVSGQLVADDGNGFPVDFSEYRFTLPSGVEMDIEQGFGVTRMEEPNGNVLTIDENGITHQPSGVGITFERDAQDRIFRITDPLNYTVEYGYDGNGDLISVTNQVSETTGFTYLPGHYLNTIVNPDGVEIAAVGYDDDGRVTSTCDFENNCSLVGYELSDNREVITDATGIATTLLYDDYGNITEITDNAGHTTYFVYDSNNNLSQVTDPNGNVTKYHYNDEGQLLSVTDPFDPADPTTVVTTTFTYNSRNQVLSITNPASAKRIYNYDNNGNLTSLRDKDGNLLVGYSYGSGGVVTSESTPLTTELYGDFDELGNPQVITDTFGQVTTYTYDTLGNVTSFTEDGIVTDVSVDGLGRVTNISDDTGYYINYDYSYGQEVWTSAEASNVGHHERLVDANGQFQGWTLPNGYQSLNDYDAAGRLSSTTNPLGLVTEYHYDYTSAGELVRVDSPSGASHHYVYDPTGQVIESTDPFNNTTKTSYMPDGQPDVITDPLGNQWDYNYTLTSTTLLDPLGREHSVEYSPEGLPLKYLNPDGTFSQFEYWLTSPLLDAASFPTRIVDEAGRERLYSYSPEGLLETASDLAGAIYTYHYAGSQFISATLPTGDTAFTLTYDENENVDSVTYPDGGIRTIASTSSGEPITITQPSGVEIVHEYDDEGNLITRTTSTGEAYQFAYDAFGALTETVDSTGSTQYLYDDLGDLSEIQYPNGMRVHYGYDMVGRVVTVTTQISATAPLYETNYEYDAGGNLSQVIDPLGGITTMEYDAVGRLITRTLPNNVQSIYSYHPTRDWVTSITHLDSDDNVLSAVTYEYDENGLSIGEPQKIIREDGSYVILGYDGALRLTSEAYFDVADVLLTRIDYAYDAAGNREVLTRTVNSDVNVSSYAYDPGYQLASITGDDGNEIYQHDTDGRLTTINRGGDTYNLSFNSRDHLTGVTANSSAITYTYDAMDRRVESTSANGTRQFLVAPLATSGLELPHLVVDETGALLGGFVYANGQPLLRFDADGNPVYYLSDARGTVLALADDSGVGVANFHYDSFGNLRSSSGPAQTPSAELGGDFRYHSAWLETATNLYHFHARDYDPYTGRFLSRDAADPSLQVPESFNYYNYAFANPQIYSDPSGYITLISVSIGDGIKGILRQTGTKTLFRWATRQMREIVSDYIKDALISGLKGLLLNLAGVDFADIERRLGGSAAGEEFEQQGQKFLCKVLPKVIARYFYWEPGVLDNGRLTSVGFKCGEGTIGNATGRGSHPDVIVSHNPLQRIKNTMDSGGAVRSRAMFIADFKLSQTLISTTSNQTKAMAHFAKRATYSQTAVWLAWRHSPGGTGGGSGKAAQIGKKYRIIAIIIVLKIERPFSFKKRI